MDNLACDQLEIVRSILPTILSPVMQLHGWWHIFAGYATYMHIIFCIAQVHIFDFLCSISYVTQPFFCNLASNIPSKGL